MYRLPKLEELSRSHGDPAAHGLIPAATVAARALEFVGVPWVHQGRSRRGVDCIGLLVCVFRELGMPVTDSTAYGRRPQLSRLLASVDEQLIRLPRDEPLSTGMCVLFFDTDWLHVGIMQDSRWVINARGPEHMRLGVVRHEVDERTWAPRLKFKWRHPLMEWAV